MVGVTSTGATHVFKADMQEPTVTVLYGTMFSANSLCVSHIARSARGSLLSTSQVAACKSVTV